MTAHKRIHYADAPKPREPFVWPVHRDYFCCSAPMAVFDTWGEAADYAMRHDLFMGVQAEPEVRMTRTISLMRDDVALAALCDDRPDLHDSLCSEAERRVQLPARRSTFSTLSTLLLWIVIAAGYGVLAAGVL